VLPTLVSWAAWAGAGLLAWTAVTILVGVSRPAFTAVAQFMAPITLAAGYPLVVVGVVTSRWALAVFGVVIALTQLLIVVPLLTREVAEPPPPGVALRVAFANVLYDNARVRDVADALIATDADIVALTEITPGWVDQLERHGLMARFGHAVSLPVREPRGVGVFSRFPVHSDRVLDDAGTTIVEVVVEVEGAAVRILAVQLPTPHEGGARQWSAAHRAVARSAASDDRALLVVGDFNAVAWHAPFRRLGRADLHDVHDLLGRGLSGSWPSPMPLLRLDHALVRRPVVPVSIVDLKIPGSDHLGFVVSVVVTDQGYGRGEGEAGASPS